MRRNFLKILSIAFFVLFFIKCADSPKSLEVFEGNAMSMNYQVLLGKNLDPQERALIETLIEKSFSFVNAHFNPFNAQSEISQFNRLNAFEEMPLSPALEEIFEEVSSIHQLSSGLFDPSVQKMHKLWKSALEEGKTPSKKEIQNLKQSIGWKHLRVADHRCIKDAENVEIDLCGIAKGKCVDLIVENLEKAGFRDFFVEWGGEIAARGRHPENRPWTVLIKGKEEEELVFVNNCSIAASGNYWQQWKSSQKIYTHIFHPIKLRPLEVHEASIYSTHVQAATCSLADAIATTLMLFESKEEALAWSQTLKEQIPNFQCWIFSDEERLAKQHLKH